MEAKNRPLENDPTASLEPFGTVAPGQVAAEAGLGPTRIGRPERRREPRYQTEDEVWLWPEGAGVGEIHGRLVDISRHGFRASHRCESLPAGERVRFRHATGQGFARVIWNRIAPEGVESGFLVL